jgi:hypothetical protein
MTISRNTKRFYRTTIKFTAYQDDFTNRKRKRFSNDKPTAGVVGLDIYQNLPPTAQQCWWYGNIGISLFCSLNPPPK